MKCIVIYNLLRNLDWRKEFFLLTVFFIGCFSFFAKSQTANESIITGNGFYKEAKYDLAISEYRKALSQEPDNSTAKFNLANALYRSNNDGESIGILDTLLKTEKDKKIRSESFYNTGTIFSNQYEKTKDVNKKTNSKSDISQNAADAMLEKSIDYYKKALRINPDDNQARENLQKALLEIKKKKPEKKQDDKKQQQQPQPQQSKMSRKEVERQLKLLQQKEKDVQQKLQQKQPQTGGQPKDW
jgi:Ca-activated chloride channel homolog